MPDPRPTCATLAVQGTRVERVISEVFEGHTVNFVKCVNVEAESTRRESFMDLSLDVKGCQNIYDSFDKYTEIELLEGANQYKAEGHGLQVRGGQGQCKAEGCGLQGQYKARGRGPRGGGQAEHNDWRVQHRPVSWVAIL